MPPMRYPVEIKVNVAGPVQDALTILGLNGGDERRIWFLEDLTPGLDPALPLLNAGVILRVRSDTSADSTVKLRPCRRTQLTEATRNAYFVFDSGVAALKDRFSTTAAGRSRTTSRSKRARI